MKTNMLTVALSQLLTCEFSKFFKIIYQFRPESMISRNRNRGNCFLSPWQTISDRVATENWEAYVARNVETKHHDQCIQWGIHGIIR